jgi:hypothetical protein
MKRILLVGVALIFACSVSFGEGKLANWPEMQAFHEVLAHTFHPAEEGDLAPIRKRSHELLADCKKVNASPIPVQYDNDKMRSALKRLEKESDKLNAFCVRQEQNSVIMKQLKEVHEIFHEIVGMCGEQAPNSVSDRGNPVKHNE